MMGELIGEFAFWFVYCGAPILIAFLLKKVARWYICILGLLLFGYLVLNRLGLWPRGMLDASAGNLIECTLWFAMLGVATLGKSEKALK
jgi:hypothetical protein